MCSNEGGAGVGEGLIGVDGDGRGRRDVDSLLNFYRDGESGQCKLRKRERGVRTSQTLELESLDFRHNILVLVRRQVVVLDEVNDVCEREHAGEAVCRRVVERGGDDTCERTCQPRGRTDTLGDLPCAPKAQSGRQKDAADPPFVTKAWRLFVMPNLLSKTMSLQNGTRSES